MHQRMSEGCYSTRVSLMSLWSMLCDIWNARDRDGAGYSQPYILARAPAAPSQLPQPLLPQIRGHANRQRNHGFSCSIPNRYQSNDIEYSKYNCNGELFGGIVTCVVVHL